jgi:hypothetical protein
MITGYLSNLLVTGYSSLHSEADSKSIAQWNDSGKELGRTVNQPIEFLNGASLGIDFVCGLRDASMPKDIIRYEESPDANS